MADQVIDLDVSATSIYIFTLVLDSEYNSKNQRSGVSMKERQE